MKYMSLKRKASINEVGLKGDQNFNLDYSIIQDSDKKYGIEIQKKFLNSTYSERAVVMFSDTKEEALDLMNKLARCEVTPLTLDYIIEDLFEWSVCSGGVCRFFSMTGIPIICDENSKEMQLPMTLHSDSQGLSKI